MRTRRPVLSFDTSAINALADDPESGALIAGVQAGFAVRLNGTNIDEVAATPDPGRREQLLDVCQRLQSAGECIQPANVIIERLVTEFDRDTRFEWTQANMRAPEYEQEVIRREVVDDVLSREQRGFARARGREFAEIFDSARPKFEDIFSNGVSRPATFAELVAILQRSGGAFWTGYSAAYYERPAAHRPDEDTVRRFVETCPPFRALVLAGCMAQYERCTRDPNVGTSYRAGRSDLLMAVYLPYCDQFVTNDDRQARCLSEIRDVAGLATEIRSYEVFRSKLTAIRYRKA